MSFHDNEVQMGAMICWAKLKADRPGPDVPVEEVAKTAFRLARSEDNTWFTTDDDVQFRIGCGVLLIHYKDTETGTRIEYTLKMLLSFSALIGGIPVNMGAVMDEEIEPLPLLGWYKETAS